MNPWLWAIGAVIAAVLEIVVPGAYLIWIAAGAAITALACFAFALALTTQLIVFIVASSVACVAGYFVYQRLITPAAGAAALNQRGLEMIGAHGVIFEAVVNGQGKVSLGDSVWIAEGPDMPAGSAVVVTGLRGTIVIVAPRH
ncbi:MAG: NfeD family protein [Pseudolabrys sp.]|nr:NfeD family protein [Pseudolabrys sp.]